MLLILPIVTLLKKLNRHTSNRVLFLVCAVTVAGCSEPNHPEFRTALAPNEFSVMCYNLHQYTLMDRDNDGIVNEPKPLKERQAVIRMIKMISPDVLAVQEMGGPLFFYEFRAELKAAGLHYPYADLLRRDKREINLAVLSRYPIVKVNHYTNEWYSVGRAKVPVSRGYQEAVIEINEHYRFHLLNAHLKSKVYSPLGQTEMRRNEARLLNKTVRKIMKADPECNLLVVGDMNDNPNSAAIREIKGKSKPILIDARPAEPGGDVWTYYDAESDTYSRIDYLFVNENMLPELQREKCIVVRNRCSYEASDHRPIVGVFRASDEPLSVPANEP